MSANPVYLEKNLARAQEELSPEAALVRDALVREGLETPMIETGLSNEEKYQLHIPFHNPFLLIPVLPPMAVWRRRRRRRRRRKRRRRRRRRRRKPR